jgi:phage terminase Nu1 subunit (DNA packaging protein)
MTTKATPANALPITKLSEMFQANRETLRKRLELVTPVGQVGKPRYTPAQVLEAYLLWERQQITTKAGLDDIDAEYEKARKDREIADKHALANAERRGELVEVADVERTWLAACGSIKQRLLGIPTKLAPLVIATDDPREAEAIISQEIEDSLHELAGTTPE